jgi:hypothetical protein
MNPLVRPGVFRAEFSSHQEAKKAVETINSATEYPINVGFEYTIKLPLLADYAPPPALVKAGKPSRTIAVHMYAGEAQAVVDAFAKHANVLSSRESFFPFVSSHLTLTADSWTSHCHGVARPTLFVTFSSVQDAEKAFGALDGKVTVSGHQYSLVYARERSKPPGPSVVPVAEGTNSSAH